MRVIVIGASLGGVDALLRITKDLSPAITAPILLVLHIGPHKSLLAELINQKSAVKAIVARSGMVPRPGCIYIAPPDQHLLYESGVLRLSRGPKEHHTRPAINPLFRSVALELGPRAIGVILTGTLDDGAAGLRAIVTSGGTAIVQDPTDAAEPSMPRSALAATPVDHVVSLSDIAEVLTKVASSREDPEQMPVAPPDWLRVEHAISLGISTMQALATIGTPSGLTCPDCGGALFELIEGRPARFLCHTGHAFSLRSLAFAHEPLTDAAVWGGLRALQEKESILRRLAVLDAEDDPATAALNLSEAESIRSFVAGMRSMVTTAAPAAVDQEAPASSLLADERRSL